MIEGWAGVAFNQVPDSANEIHGDRVAAQYGFRGGLVPGVTISAYLTHPAVVAWGLDFLERGTADIRVGAPLYDGEPFRVTVLEQDETSYRADIRQRGNDVSATATVALPTEATPAPRRRGDPLVPEDYRPPTASPETFARLKADGCLAFPFHWGSPHPMQRYLRDPAPVPALWRLDGDGYANSAFLLGCSNWILAGNARMNPWVHLQTRSRHFHAVAPDTGLITEMAVRDCYSKKGHEFVDVDVNLFRTADDACVCAMELRAIYRLRGL